MTNHASMRRAMVLLLLFVCCVVLLLVGVGFSSYSTFSNNSAEQQALREANWRNKLQHQLTAQQQQSSQLRQQLTAQEEESSQLRKELNAQQQQSSQLQQQQTAQHLGGSPSRALVVAQYSESIGWLYKIRDFRGSVIVYNKGTSGVGLLCCAVLGLSNAVTEWTFNTSRTAPDSNYIVKKAANRGRESATYLVIPAIPAIPFDVLSMMCCSNTSSTTMKICRSKSGSPRLIHLSTTQTSWTSSTAVATIFTPT